MTKKEAQLIESKFYTYRENARRAAELGRNKALEFIAGGFGRTSSPTNRNGVEKSVIDAVSEAEEISRWCIVVEKTLDRFHFDPKEKLILSRYFKGYSVLRVCLDVGISESTFSNWRREILEHARRWAITLHLIDGTIGPY